MKDLVAAGSFIFCKIYGRGFIKMIINQLNNFSNDEVIEDG